MVLKQYISPVVIANNGTKIDGLREIRYFMLNSMAMWCENKNGTCYQDANGHAFVYNIEVAKRKKYRKNPCFHVYIYRISKRWLNENRKKLVQHERNFTIENS